MANRARQKPAAEPCDPTALRLLVELPALRKLADRGLSDEELAMTRKLAEATLGPALSGDVPGYVQADMMFHLHLLELTGDPVLPEVARLLLAPGAEHGPRGMEPDMRMAVAAWEHCEIVSLLTDDMVHAAVDMLRHHVAQDGVRRPVRAGLDAFFRHQGDAPSPASSALIGALVRLTGSDDPAVTFARLARACVPAFADACQVELGDGKEPPLRVRHPANPTDGAGRAEAQPAGANPQQVLVTPFRVASRTGYPSYAGVVTHWWASRAPAEGDAVIADLMVKHAIALVDRERLLAAVAQAEERAANLALEMISDRVIGMATGIVMHQRGLSQDDAEDVLRTAAAVAGGSLSAVAMSVVHSGSLARSPACDSQRVPARRMALIRPGSQ
jgi:FCD domain/ANTAR domain